MSKIYNLYLDESHTHDGNQNHIVFVMAGIIVSEEYANNSLVDDINNVKRIIWEDSFPSNYKDLILHELDIKGANHRRNRHKLHTYSPEYQIFRSEDKIKTLYRELEKVIRNGNIVTLAACVKEDDISSLYNKNLRNDNYLISLQIIIENFVHFLNENNAKGRIIYEHNGDNNIKSLRMKFNIIKTMGTLFINPEIIQEKLLDIEFIEKSENNPGLQIADFIPNVVARKISGAQSPSYNIFKVIKRVSYDGNVGLKDKFGIKVIK